MIQIIVNADDLGISHEVNDATFSLMAEGLISSATLLANGPAIGKVINCAPQFPQCSFGAHLNLTEFQPLCRAAEPLLTRDGGMSRGLVETSAWRPRFMQAAYQEFSAQITKLLNGGVSISHLDSHHHVHTIPWLFPVVKAVQVRFGIRKIRRSRNIYSSCEQIGRSLRAKKAFYNRALANLYASKITDGFTDLETFLAMNAEETSRFRSIEIMVHPGAGPLQKEVLLLRGDRLKSLPFATRLISYSHWES